jgi:hypothetical protein
MSMIESDLSETVTVRAVRPDVLTAEVSVLVERSNGDRRVLIFPAATPATVPQGLIVVMFAGIVYFIALTVWVASEVHR